jgi:hypothetical protein
MKQLSCVSITNPFYLLLNSWHYIVSSHTISAGVHKIRAPGRHDDWTFLLWRLIYVYPQYWTCFVSPLRHSWMAPTFLVNLSTPRLRSNKLHGTCLVVIVAKFVGGRRKPRKTSVGMPQKWTNVLGVGTEAARVLGGSERGKCNNLSFC